MLAPRNLRTTSTRGSPSWPPIAHGVAHRMSTGSSLSTRRAKRATPSTLAIEAALELEPYHQLGMRRCGRYGDRCAARICGLPPGTNSALLPLCGARVRPPVSTIPHRDYAQREALMQLRTRIDSKLALQPDRPDLRHDLPRLLASRPNQPARLHSWAVRRSDVPKVAANDVVICCQESAAPDAQRSHRLTSSL